MSEKVVNNVLERFFALGEDNKKITDESAAARKEYEDYCISSDEDLDKKTGEILKKVNGMEALMQYAREHATDLEEASAPFETSEGALESLRQKIALESRNDPNAETLYTKASGQKLLFQQEIDRVRNLINGSKVQAKRLYDSTMEKLNEKRSVHIESFRSFINSEELKVYLKNLSSDAFAFNSSGMAQLSDISEISLGQRRVRLPVPEELEQELSINTEGIFNSASKTINAPFSMPIDRGSVLYVDFDERNESYMMGGIQRFLLNTVKYFGGNLDGIFFLDPIKYDAEGLGHIGALSKGANAFITLPDSKAAAERELDAIISELSAAPKSGKIRRVMVFRSFPEAYDADTAEKIKSLCENAESYNICAILTHKSDSDGGEAEKAVRAAAVTIRSRNGGFYLESTREGILWYSAPASIPDEIRRTYIEQRRAAEPKSVPEVHAPEAHIAEVQTTSVHEEPIVEEEPDPVAEEPVEIVESVPEEEPAVEAVEEEAPADEPEEEAVEAVDELEVEEAPEEEPAAEAPAPEAVESVETASAENETTYKKGVRDIKIPFGRDNAFELSFEDSPVYITAKHRERGRILRSLIDGVTSAVHPDDTELWLIDLTKTALLKYAKNTPPHVRYLVLDDNSGTAFAVMDRLEEVIRKRVNLFRGRWETFSEIPANVYMPELLVVVNGFSGVDRQFVYGGFAGKLADIADRGRDYGVRFVFADSFEPEQYCAEGCVMITSAGSTAKIVTAGKGEVSVQLGEESEPIRGDLIASDSYVPDDNGVYFDKKAIVADKGVFRSFESRRGDFEDKISQKAVDDMLLFMGEPYDISQTFTATVYTGFAQNLLVSASAEDKAYAALVLLSITSSLTMQEIPFEIFTTERNVLYSYLSENTPSDAEMISEGIDKVCGRLNSIAGAIAEDRSDNRFVVIFGIAELASEMTTLGEIGQQALRDLSFIIERGSRSGYHFVVVENEEELENIGISPAMFAHKFNCLGMAERSVQYSSVENVSFFMPYLHKGITVDCFEVDDNGEVTAVLPKGLLI
ncbi:MAG: hypothetical protein K2O14_11460 [Oscillospiraceae bacterium]|nr:hypothetical protein [Oscillospiraceae bacterium]